MADGEGMTLIRTLIAAALLSGPAMAAGPLTITSTTAAKGQTPLSVHVGGRVDPLADGYRRQWPGSYFEAAFRGRTISFEVGTGDVILHVSVDDGPPATLVKPKPGVYRIGGLTNGTHRIRVDVATESQAAATVFGGFRVARGMALPPPPARARQIEFIGDSHTVGYGNRSAKRDCTEAEVWATTDTSWAMPAQLSRRYAADYQVNAISGRGVVRNYDGMIADTVPAAYPFTTFDKRRRFADPAWRPGVIVISLGTNDFTTPLHAGERWKSRDALHADYRREYVAFVRRLRARNPDAQVLLWATDMAGGEIATQVAQVADQLAAAGDRRVTFIPVTGLTFAACHAHPSIADDTTIASALAAYIDTHAALWTGG